MLDIKRINKNPHEAKKMLRDRGYANDESKIDLLQDLDRQRLVITKEADSLKEKRNKASKRIASIKKEKGDAHDLLCEMKLVSDKIVSLNKQLRQVKEKERSELYNLPNFLHQSTPIGKSSKDNVVCKECLETQRKHSFQAKDHVELGISLGILDFIRGSKMSGPGFPVYIGKGALLERALISFMMDIHIEKHSYVEILPPFLVNEQSLIGTGQLPKFRDQVYTIKNYDLFTIPTGEVPITNFHRDEVLSSENLPIKYVGYSPCFRSEAGSYGKDVKGLLRVHQFNKVEMVMFTTPSTSYLDLETMRQNAEDVLIALELPYRVVELCSGDLGAGATKCYDIEVWGTVEKKFLEVSSCSNFEDFQSRRANIRFKSSKKAKPEFVHTLNASGLATPRLMIALLEHYQTENGNVHIPKPLQSYMKMHTI